MGKKDAYLVKMRTFLFVLCYLGIMSSTNAKSDELFPAILKRIDLFLSQNPMVLESFADVDRCYFKEVKLLELWKPKPLEMSFSSIPSPSFVVLNQKIRIYLKSTIDSFEETTTLKFEDITAIVISEHHDFSGKTMIHQSLEIYPDNSLDDPFSKWNFEKYERRKHSFFEFETKILNLSNEHPRSFREGIEIRRYEPFFGDVVSKGNITKDFSEDLEFLLMRRNALLNQ